MDNLVELYEMHGIDEVQDAILKAGKFFTKNKAQDQAEHAVQMGYNELFEYLKPRFKMTRSILENFICVAFDNDEQKMAFYLADQYASTLGLSPMILYRTLRFSTLSLTFNYAPWFSVNHKSVVDIHYMGKCLNEIINIQSKDDREQLLEILSPKIGFEKLLSQSKNLSLLDKNTVSKVQEWLAKNQAQNLQASTPNVAVKRKGVRL